MTLLLCWINAKYKAKYEFMFILMFIIDIMALLTLADIFR
jgi:hypothetical protein